MLRTLSIENIAVIEKCNIDFNDGFNCLTGETGAGKSIVIDAINAVTGQRTSKELIRTGCEKATVTAVFDDIDKNVCDFLSDYGISIPEDRSILISRTINTDGRNTCKINGIIVNVAALKDIGKELVNIHGQHDNQALLDSANHCSYIDSFGKHYSVLDSYKECYEQLKFVRKQLKLLKSNSDEKEKQKELLNFQINEIEIADIKVGELGEAIIRRDILRNSEKIKETLEYSYLILSGNDNEKGVLNSVVDIANNVASVSKIMNEANKLSDGLFSVSSELSDLTVEIRNIIDILGFDPNELEILEERIDLIKSLCKKYGGDETSILEYLKNAKEELFNIDNSDELINELQEQSDLLDDKIIEIGSKLTFARRKAADDFSAKVCDILKYLQMPNVVFSTDISEGIYTANGCDDVEFLISANLGQDAKPLSKTASGGELSRTMLAIKSVLTDEEDVCTLIFDEIDTGISGMAADRVARQLKLLSKSKQIICVTHLAQIAASADNHLLITKSTSDGETYTDVNSVTGDDRIKEIARIVSGSEITENVYKTAKELIENHSIM